MTTLQAAQQELLTPTKIDYQNILLAATQELDWTPTRETDAIFRENNRIKGLGKITTHVRRHPDGTETQFTNVEFSNTKFRKVAQGKAKLRGRTLDAEYLADWALSTCRKLMELGE